MEENLKNSFKNGYSKGLGFGVLLMIVGVLFLGFNFKIFPEQFKHVVFSWPMILIVVGIGNFFRRHVFTGTILLIIGGFFLIPKIIYAYPDYFPGINGNFTHIYWPLLLILAGVLMILSRTFGPKWGFSDWSNQSQQQHYHKRKYEWEGQNGGFSKNSVFGSGEHIVLEPEFKGGEINAIFGGIKLDLRKTNLSVGETRLEVNAVFGGVTIYVPNDWYIETHLDTVFGGFEDKRLAQSPSDTTRKLVIAGSCVFGGGELRN